jgi:type VI secretion system secreted protein Hcp
MAFDAFLKIAGIDGESTDAAHTAWIEILSFHHGLAQSSVGTQASAHGAYTSGRVDMSDFTVVKSIDKASPLLALACCKGDHVDDVTVELCRAGGDKQKYMEYKLVDVLVASVRPGGSSKGEGLPLEEVAFRFGKINWTYIPLDDKGQPQGQVPAGWDLEGNVPA